MSALAATVLTELQRKYLADCVMSYQREADLLPLVEKMSEKVQTNYNGRQQPIQTSPNASFGFGNPNGGDLVTPSAGSYTSILIPYVWANIGVQINYENLMNEGREMAVASQQARELKDVAHQMTKWMNRYYSAGNGTAAIATVSANYSGGTPTIATCNGSTDTIGCSFVEVGQRVLVYDATGATQRTGTVGAGAITIASKTGTALTGSSNFPSDMVATDIIVPEQVVSAATGWAGLPYIISASGTYFGKSRTTYPTLQSTVVNLSGALTAASLFKTWSLVFQKNGKSPSFEMCTNITMNQAYYELTAPVSGGNHYFVHTGDSRPQMDVGGSDFDFTWFGTRIRRLLDAPGKSIFFVNWDVMKIANLKDLGELKDLPAGGWLNAINTTGGYTASKQTWRDVARQNFSPEPFRLGVLDNITVTGFAMQKDQVH